MSTSDRKATLDCEIGVENISVEVHINIVPAREEIKQGPNAAPYEEVEVDIDKVMLKIGIRSVDILDLLADETYDKIWQKCWVAVKEGKV